MQIFIRGNSCGSQSGMYQSLLHGSFEANTCMLLTIGHVEVDIKRLFLHFPVGVMIGECIKSRCIYDTYKKSEENDKNIWIIESHMIIVVFVQFFFLSRPVPTMQRW